MLALIVYSICVFGLGPTAEATQPNIVLIMSDDAGYAEFGFNNQLTGYQTPNAVTPRLDELAAQSVVMRQGYTASPLCTQSRVGMLLGQYHQRHGLEHALDLNIASPFGLDAEHITMAERLKELGYTTGAIGKWHLGYTAGVNRPGDQGFDEFFGFLGGARQYYGQEVNPSYQIRRNDTVVESTWANAQNGGYLTDAFGQEAVSFINNHADDENPFFLYVAFNNPHTPFANGPNNNGTAVVDFNQPQIAQISDTTNRIIAAANHGMDRNVGSIMSALSAQGIDDNTIVVFVNDNGGPLYGPTHHNQPFSGSKGLAVEGGIRIAYLMKIPGVMPRVYDQPVSTYDLLPTFLEAAGGDAATIDGAPGVDLMPFLDGAETGRPHETMFWRVGSFWAVRKGDWKFGRPVEPHFQWPLLHDMAADPIETFVNSQTATRPDKVAELQREFTFWEATLAKAEFGVAAVDNRNKFDHFVFRNDLASVTKWGTANAWRQADTTNNKTLLTDDAYANAILEFTTRNDADYTATNDMARMSGLTFMLNQLRFTGDFTGEVNRKATINGGPLDATINGRLASTSGSTLLLTKSLTGVLPRLQLDATSSDTSAGFKFEVAHALELLDDLEIVGNGTQEFVFTGAIRDYFEPRSVVKSGTSRISLRGASSYHGGLTINEGEVRFDAAGSSLNGPSSITIGASGKLRLDLGSIVVPTIDNSAGGQLELNGGRLAVVDVLGNLTNNGTTYAPGASPAFSTISGDFIQNSGRLEIEIGGDAPGAEFDQLAVSGNAALGGRLEVKLVSGFVPTFGDKFEFLTASSVEGSFTAYTLPTLANGQSWSLQSGNGTVSLLVGLPGDYNGNGVVDAADYTVWRNTLGQATANGAGADGNHDSQITEADYDVWKNNYGAVRIASGSGAGSEDTHSIPEPTSLALVTLAALCLAALRTRQAPLRSRFTSLDAA